MRGCLSDSQIRLGHDQLRFVAALQPTEASRIYAIQIDYTLRHIPKVQVLEPELQPNHLGVLPHFYRDGYLCLHEWHEWEPWMRIVDTTLPWTSEWLAFYEIWLATGCWYGDGDADGRELHGVEDGVVGLPRAMRRRQARRATTARRAV